MKRVVALLVALALIVPVCARAESEREMGRRFHLQARSQLPIIEDPALVGYVSGIGSRIVEALGPQEFDYHFFVVAHPALNAFAVPGGYVYVFSGLLAAVHNDDELAGVLAHEVGHAHAHHIVRMQTAGAGWTAASLAGILLSMINPVLGAGAIAAAQTAQLKFSRDFEQEADFLGLRFTTRAGYDPHALGAFFKELLREQRVNPAGVPAYMLSHPITEDRIAHVESTITAQKLVTPAGRPASSPLLAEVQAVARGIGEPTDVVVANYRQEVEKKPRDASRHFLLGRVYETVGQYDAARRSLERARELGGSEDQVDRTLGSVYVVLRAKEARSTLERYLTRNPDDATAHLNLGKALATAGDDDAALREYQRAIALNGDLDEAQRLAGVLLGRKGKEGDGYYHLAMASMERGDLDQALVQFERAIDLLPPGSPRYEESKRAIEELNPLVGEIRRARAEAQRDRERRRRSP